jgi:transposase
MSQSYPTYPSNLTEEQWELLRHLIPAAKAGGRPRTVDIKAVVNAIVYINIDSSQLVEQSRHTQPTQSVPFKGKGTMSLVALGGYLGYRYFRKRKS